MTDACKYLPICHKDNRFNHDKLRHRVEWPQEVTASHIEKRQGIQCNRVRDSVDYGDVQIRLVHTEVTACVFPLCIEYEGDHNKNWLENYKLECPLFAPSYETPVQYFSVSVCLKGHTL